MQYGSIRLDGGAPAAPAKGVFRAAALALAALACVVFVAVVSVERSATSVQPTALCTDVDCMLNSPTAPAGAAPTAPRTLDPSEVERLQASLAEETELEKKVTNDMNALSGEGKVQVNVIVSPAGIAGNRGPFGHPGSRGEVLCPLLSIPLGFRRVHSAKHPAQSWNTRGRHRAPGHLNATVWEPSHHDAPDADSGCAAFSDWRGGRGWKPGHPRSRRSSGRGRCAPFQESERDAARPQCAPFSPSSKREGSLPLITCPKQDASAPFPILTQEVCGW